MTEQPETQPQSTFCKLMSQEGNHLLSCCIDTDSLPTFLAHLRAPAFRGSFVLFTGIKDAQDAYVRLGSISVVQTSLTNDEVNAVYRGLLG